MQLLWFAVAIIGSAIAQDEASLLAPSAADVRASVLVANDALAVADAVAKATAQTHNAWVTAGDDAGGCSPDTVSAVARSVVFGTAWRDAVQQVREVVTETNSMMAMPTVQPLLNDQDAFAVAGLDERVATHERALAEAMVWHSRYFAAAQRRCAPALAAFAPPDPGSRGAQDLVALAWTGPGVLCVDGEALSSPERVVLTRGRVCVAPSATCGCIAQRAVSGAVMGPTTVSE